MENIIEPNENFDFSRLSLAHPSGIQGGAYFTKIEFNKKPLYIQTCKSQTKQGFVKTGKKYYCDLMFDKNAETLIHWFENLEERCRKLIYEKKDTWFQNSLEESDIETAFNSTIRIYKSGKFYLVRTNIKNTPNHTPSIKIYNEQEVSLTMDDILPETNIISILEIQGIKFTSRNFQIEIEQKQIMVLEDEPLFDSCLIKTNRPLQEKGVNVEKNVEKGVNVEKNVEKDTEAVVVEQMKETVTPCIDLENLKSIDMNELIDDNNDKIDDSKIDSDLDKNLDLDLNLEVEELFEDIEEKSKELEKLDVDLELNKNTNLNLEPLTLKKPNQVYFELYKEAVKKAKNAKKNAIIAYLEAKNIKKTYLLDNLNDSDSDNELEAEIDEVSESELEDF